MDSRIDQHTGISIDNFYWNSDCRYFAGGLPCKFWNPCNGCANYEPINSRVLIVMLGLLGDMLIASPLPAKIKRENPKAHITWLVDETCAAVLRMNPFIDRVLNFNWESATHLLSETFDSVFSFERTPSAASLVERISSIHKSGLAFGGKNNALYAIGESAEHFFKMNLWNDYRTKINQKTWTELYFEVAGYSYVNEPYVLEIPIEVEKKVNDFLVPSESGTRICLNVGGSLTTKKWPKEHWLSLGKKLLDEKFCLVITGGPTEVLECEFLLANLSIYNNGYGGNIKYRQLSIEELCACIKASAVVVTGDTFGFHLALAFNKKCVAMFGPSNCSEVVPKHKTNISINRSSLECSPCAHQVICGGVGGCMDTIKPDDIFIEVRNFLLHNSPCPT